MKQTKKQSPSNKQNSFAQSSQHIQCFGRREVIARGGSGAPRSLSILKLQGPQTLGKLVSNLWIPMVITTDGRCKHCSVLLTTTDSMLLTQNPRLDRVFFQDLGVETSIKNSRCGSSNLLLRIPGSPNYQDFLLRQ